MAYDVKATKTYSYPAEKLTDAVSTVIGTLGGKPSKKNNPAAGRLEANFNKKIKGQYMSNRCQLEVKVVAQTPEQSTLSVEAYPVDPIGGKLMFGVMGKPAQLVIDTFFAELEGHLNR